MLSTNPGSNSDSGVIGVDDIPPQSDVDSIIELLRGVEGGVDEVLSYDEFVALGKYNRPRYNNFCMHFLNLDVSNRDEVIGLPDLRVINYLRENNSDLFYEIVKMLRDNGYVKKVNSVYESVIDINLDMFLSVMGGILYEAYVVFRKGGFSDQELFM